MAQEQHRQQQRNDPTSRPGEGTDSPTQAAEEGDAQATGRTRGHPTESDPAPTAQNEHDNKTDGTGGDITEAPASGRQDAVED